MEEEDDRNDRETELAHWWLAGSEEPVYGKPALFGLQGFATQVEWPKKRASNGREIRNPAALAVGFDVAGPGNQGLTELSEIDVLGVDGPYRAVGKYHEVHQPSPPAVALRRIRRLGRLMSISSSVVCTRASCVATS